MHLLFCSSQNIAKLLRTALFLEAFCFFVNLFNFLQSSSFPAFNLGALRLNLRALPNLQEQKERRELLATRRETFQNVAERFGTLLTSVSSSTLLETAPRANRLSTCWTQNVKKPFSFHNSSKSYQVVNSYSASLASQSSFSLRETAPQANRLWTCWTFRNFMKLFTFIKDLLAARRSTFQNVSERFGTLLAFISSPTLLETAPQATRLSTCWTFQTLRTFTAFLKGFDDLSRPKSVLNWAEEARGFTSNLGN